MSGLRAAAAVLLFGLPGTSVAAQACPDGVISTVFIDNHSIFDSEELAAVERFEWAYRLANTLHVRTRQTFIRRELLFAEGDCYDPLILAESERLLRRYRFLARVDVFGAEQADGSWHVVVDTQDEWTTRVSVQGTTTGGPHVERVGVTEQNLLGRGILVGGSVRTVDGRRDFAARIDLPRLGPTRVDAGLRWGRSEDDGYVIQSLAYPFLGEVGRLAASETFLRRETSFRYVAGARSDAASGVMTELYLPFEEQQVEITLAGRIGSPGNLTVIGVGFTNETLEFPEFPGRVEAAFSGREGRSWADSAVAWTVRGQTMHSAGTHVNLMVAQRNVRFAELRGLDALRGTRDVPLGTHISLVIGRSVGALSSGAHQPDDLYGSLRAEWAGRRRGLLMIAGGGAEARQVFAGGERGKPWSDVLAETTALLYWQPTALPSHTFFLRAAGVGGWSVTQPFQLTLGGASGVRGYDQDEWPGGRRLVFNAEDRIYLSWPSPDLFDFGLTLLADAGRIWPGDAPFGADSGWRGTVGGGLRLGFPAGSRRVARLDLGWPVSAAGIERAPYLRVSIGDPVGVSAGLADGQLGRTRVDVGPDRFTEHLR